MEVTLQEYAASNLGRLLEATGISQSEMGRIVDVSRVQISRILHGHSGISLDTCQAIAEHFGLPINALCQAPHQFEKLIKEISAQHA